ncbi:glycerophosphatase [Rhodococcoides trifolii]|uniref:Glycerophosphatase n=1 Tax=Rhodococcoides trifolii TaxID=908250 RepID=A0A917D429_9NOCA|nr:glycerophosphatase [Rhodococcus trifolii]
MTRRARAADLALVRAVSSSRPLLGDAALRRLSQSANHSRLWIVVSLALAASGGSRRRAAVRGLLSVVGASALANGLLKPIFPRDRPPVDSAPVLRRLLDPPLSSSFPSGHSASAAAFAAGVALESPAAGLAIAPLAAAVAYSRVHVGVHWPSDVVAGAALGTAVALSTRRWWAVRSEDPAELASGGNAPALPGGEGMVILVNPSAGVRDSDQNTAGIVAMLEEHLPKAELFEPDTDRDFAEQLTERIGADTQALGVCGGDGTVATAVGVAIEAGLPLAVFPGGTLNHFARDTGLVDVEACARGIETGESAMADIGHVSVDDEPGRYFINTASMGGYPDSVLLRDEWEPKIGKWPAAAAAMVAVLAVAKPLVVSIDGRRESIWMIFVGNGKYAPADQVPMSRPSMSGGVLDIRYLRANMKLSRTRLLFAALTGTLGSSPTYTHLREPSIRVQDLQKTLTVAVDGEVYGEGRAFEFDARPSLLTLYQPVGNKS